MNKIIFSTVSFLIMVFFFSCKKDNDSKSKTQLLTQKSWLISNAEERTGTEPWSQDAGWSSSPACEKDDVTVFKTNFTYETNEGATKCNTSDPQIINSGTWAFSDNETKLNLDGDLLTIERLDETNLILTLSEVFLGTTYSFRITLRH
jgi:hypothetical protein